MRKSHLYIFQISCILVLFFSYYLGDIPDNLSVMHVNSSSSKTIAPVNNNHENNNSIETNLTSKCPSSNQLIINEYVHNAEFLPSVIQHSFMFGAVSIIKIAIYRVHYNFLFFKEINPPPPFC